MISVPLGQVEPQQERSRMLKPISVFFWNQFKPLSLLLRLFQNKLVLETSSFNDKRVHLPHLFIPARFVLFGECHLLLLAIELTALQVLKHLHQRPRSKQEESCFCFTREKEKQNAVLTALQNILTYCSLLDQYFTSSKVRAVFTHISSRN